MNQPPIVSLSGVSYSYPFTSRPALMDVDLELKSGELLLCTGASGCGKSTLVRLINGLAPHYFRGTISGTVLVDGVDNSQRQVFEISRKVGTLFQDPEQQFFALNAEDELAFAHEWRGSEKKEIRRLLRAVITRFGLGMLLGQSVTELSEGQKQKLALAGIISLLPKIIILDEPSANLDPESTLELARELKELKESGMSIVVVDHRLYWLKGIADRLLVFRDGRIVEQIAAPFSGADGACGQQPESAHTRANRLRSDYGLRRMEVSDPRARLAGLPKPQEKPPLLRAEGLCFSYKNKPPIFSGLGFSLPAGEVVALCGPNGAGKTTLARLLTGLNKMSSGRIFLFGEEISPARLMKHCSLALQNTDHQLHMKTVSAELYGAASSLPLDWRDDAVEESLAGYGLESLAGRHPQSLSGGEKQRLVIACAMIRKPELLILDEPTSGLDGRNLEIIAKNIKRFVEYGASVLLISHDLELLEMTCGYQLFLCPKQNKGECDEMSCGLFEQNRQHQEGSRGGS